MKFISWNIDSINAALTSDSARALLSREVLRNLKNYDADIIAIQETKLSANGPTKVHSELLKEIFFDYDLVWVSSVEPAKKGYAGNMVLYKNNLKPNISFPKINAPEPMDFEGRMITLEFDTFYFTCVYTPNAGDSLLRLPLRQEWDKAYLKYLLELKAKKNVIATGDFNVAHKEIDLAHPKTNRRSPGFTDEEREGFDNIIKAGFVDTFRHINGDIEGVYTWWAQRVKTSKINNAGWRIDYFLVNEEIKDKVISSQMIDSGTRQDHTPIIMEINDI